MNNIIKIKDLPTNAKIELCKQIEHKSFDDWSKRWARVLRLKLIFKKLIDEKQKSKS
jgi:hypothetical protein